MALDPLLQTPFEADFMVIEDDNCNSFLLPDRDNCSVIIDAESQVLGYIVKSAASAVARVLNQAWDNAEKRRQILYRLAKYALSRDPDLCDANDMVEDFEEIIAGRFDP